MKTGTNLRIVTILALSCAGAGSAQKPPDVQDNSDVRIVSSFVAVGEPVPAACEVEAHTLAQSLLLYPRPASWHWVLVCDDAGWRRFLRLSGRDEEAAIYASTDLVRRITYIRGSKLLYPFDLFTGPSEIIAHEIAHIWRNDSSEPGADKLAKQWEKRSP